MPMCVNVFKHIHCMTVTSYGTHLTNKLEGVNHHSGMLDACYAYIYIHMNDYECIYIYAEWLLSTSTVYCSREYH